MYNYTSFNEEEKVLWTDHNLADCYRLQPRLHTSLKISTDQISLSVYVLTLAVARAATDWALPTAAGLSTGCTSDKERELAAISYDIICARF